MMSWATQLFSDICLDFCFNGISESTKIILHQNRSQSESNRLQSSTLRLIFYLISRKNRSHSDLGQKFYVHPSSHTHTLTHSLKQAVIV